MSNSKVKCFFNAKTRAACQVLDTTQLLGDRRRLIPEFLFQVFYVLKGSRDQQWRRSCFSRSVWPGFREDELRSKPAAEGRFGFLAFDAALLILDAFRAAGGNLGGADLGNGLQQLRGRLGGGEDRSFNFGRIAAHLHNRRICAMLPNL